MNYPVWNTGNIGASVIVGLIAVTHVLIAQFAVGGGLFLVMKEMKARRDNNGEVLDYLRRLSFWFTRLTLVFGAVSGVGIWWAISLTQPAGTSVLIHVFVWAWAIEWVTFLVEVVAVLVYYYGWTRLDAKTHVVVGWIYFVSAWLSLFFINGILSFMLTPGDWPQTHAFADGFFNPTMLPSLALRSASCIALAGVLILFDASMEHDAALRKRLCKYCAKWVIVGVSAMAPLALWYIAMLPPLAQEITLGGAPAITIFAFAVPFLSAGIVLIAVLGPLRQPAKMSPLIAGIILVGGIIVTGIAELVREGVRKPWIIYREMYANALRPADIERANQQGALALDKWDSVGEVTPENELRAGRELFRTQCQSCHTIDAYNGIRPMVRGWSEELIDHQLEHLNEIKGFMPPFAGSERERKALAKWLYKLGKDKPFSRLPDEAAK